MNPNLYDRPGEQAVLLQKSKKVPKWKLDRRSCMAHFRLKATILLLLLDINVNFFRGENDGLAPISADVCQRNHRPRVLGVVGRSLSDAGQDLRGQRVDRWQQVPQGGKS